MPTIKLNHSVEPWIYKANSTGTPIMAENGKKFIASIARSFTDPIDERLDTENARRICACINFLDGIPSEYLEQYVQDGMKKIVEILKLLDLAVEENKELRSYIEKLEGRQYG